MTPNMITLRQRMDCAQDAVNVAQEQVTRIKTQIEEIERKCNHQWLKPTQKSSTKPGYTIPADPPGTMGVDRRGEQYVGPETTVWWERICANCGKMEKTEKSEPTGEVRPVF